ncbi:MAG: IS3 family transposase [Pseudomonadota bacterium]|nr:IS3 family transposase [Pseudomonadota bacterium]
MRRGCQMIELPRSTYYYRATAMGSGLTDNRLVELIGDIQDEFAGYGYRRVTCELRVRGYPINHKRAARIMREHGLGIKPRKRFTPRQNGSEGDTQFFPNRYRNVIPSLLDQAWVADITFVRIQTGFVYVAVILDACSRKVVGYAISRQIDTNLTLAALKAAVRTRQPTPNTCIHHTDRGSQGGFNRSSQHYRF